MEIYQSDLEEFLNISAKLEIQGIADKKVNKEMTPKCDIVIDETKKENFTDHETTYTMQDFQINSLSSDFKSDLAYKTEFFDAETSSKPLPNHDISNINEHALKNNRTKIIKYSGLKRRGPIWNHFVEDKTDRSFVFCTACQKKLSRGKPGNPASKFYIAGMRRHLKTHKDIWKIYVKSKDSHQTEDRPKSFEEFNEPVSIATKYTE